MSTEELLFRMASEMRMDVGGDTVWAGSGTTNPSLIAPRADVLYKEMVRAEDVSMSLDSVRAMVEGAEEVGDASAFESVVRRVRTVFGSSELLAAAFVVPGSDNADPSVCGLDMDAVVESYHVLYGASVSKVGTSVRQSLEYLMTDVAVNAPLLKSHLELRQMVIALLNPYLLDEEASNLFRKTTLAVASLSDDLKRHLQSWLAAAPQKHLSNMVATLQSYILVRTIEYPDLDPHRDNPIISAVRTLQVFHRANGERGGAKEPPLPDRDFYNDAVNRPEFIDLVEDYQIWMQEPGNAFSFCKYPFLLDAATKADIVFLESEILMRAEGRRAMLQSILSGPVSPYLVLRVRRDNIIQDTLNQLTQAPPTELKKEMKVKFVGEDGIDEGGVRKEFFQVIVRELFDPKYGMFRQDDDTDLYYFSSASLEDQGEFRLCGIILGLAIYNKVIIDMHFPRVVYKRLCGAREFDLADLMDAMPSVGRSLQYIRDEYDGDFADLALYFDYTYDNFGQSVSVDLVPNGSNIPVTAENVDAYVKAYVKYVLEDAVATQFAAFQEGFLTVVDPDRSDHAAISLFQPAELELLICGSENLDLHELEEVTQYEGFTEESTTIQHFWEIVHGLDLDMKKKLLFFTTGSDRVPIKGLRALNFVIMRHGSDSDSLPTSHTCYNHLLLPDYQDNDKLRRLLITAITNSEGFGLI